VNISYLLSLQRGTSPVQVHFVHVHYTIQYSKLRAFRDNSMTCLIMR